MKLVEQSIKIEEYLAFKRDSQTKHEFLFESIIPKESFKKKLTYTKK